MSEPTPPSYEESQKYALYPGGAQGSAGGTQETPLGPTPYPEPQQPYPMGGLQGYPAVSQPQPGFQIAVDGQVPPKPHPWYFQPPSSQYQGSAGFPQQPGYPLASQPYPGVSYGQPYAYTTPNVGYTTATNTVTTYPPTVVVTTIPHQFAEIQKRRKFIIIFIVLMVIVFIILMILIM